MDAVASALSMLYPNQTIDDLVNTIYTYVQTNLMDEDDPGPLQERSLKSTIYSNINGYLNLQSGESLFYNPIQLNFAYELTQGVLEIKNPEDILQHIKNVEDRITSSGLSATEQMPLLYSSAVGKAAYSYWANVLNNPMTNWSNFITSFTPNIVKFPSWVVASIEGTLIGLSMYQNNLNGRVAAELQLVLNYAGANTLLALFGSLGVGAGKAIFKFQPRELSPCPDIVLPNNNPNIEIDNNHDCGCNK
jgi:hypothetical protein